MVSVPAPMTTATPNPPRFQDLNDVSLFMTKNSLSLSREQLKVRNLWSVRGDAGSNPLTLKPAFKIHGTYGFRAGLIRLAAGSPKRGGTRNTLADLVVTWLAYSLLGWIFLDLDKRFKVPASGPSQSRALRRDHRWALTFQRTSGFLLPLRNAKVVIAVPTRQI